MAKRKSLTVAVPVAAMIRDASLPTVPSTSAPIGPFDQAMAMGAWASATGDIFHQRGDYATASRYYGMADVYYGSAAA